MVPFRSQASTTSSGNGGGHTSSGIGSCESSGNPNRPVKSHSHPPLVAKAVPSSPPPPKLPPKPSLVTSSQRRHNCFDQPVERGHISLRSLLATLPAESVDIPSSPEVHGPDKRRCREEPPSMVEHRLSDISATNSFDSGDFDSYFYI